MLQRVVVRLADEVGVESEEVAPVGDGKSDAPAAARSGAITTPLDVENALDRIMAYYAAYEPSSPVPVILKRAKRLVGADFMTIMKDIAPGGVDNVMLVGGIASEE
jgi:type VI secretion system protein ImpA